VGGLFPKTFQGLEDGDEVEEAAKVTEEVQMRNWVENHECVCPESQIKKMSQERGSDHLCQVLLLIQVR